MNQESKLLIGALKNAVSGKKEQLNTAVDQAAFLVCVYNTKIRARVPSQLTLNFFHSSRWL